LALTHTTDIGGGSSSGGGGSGGGGSRKNLHFPLVPIRKEKLYYLRKSDYPWKISSE